MIDLNHASGPIVPSPMPKMQIITGTAITEYIDRALVEKKEAEPERDYIGASELGDPCLRRVYLNAIKAAKSPLTGRRARIFEMGHVFENMMARWIKLGGFELQERDPATGEQFEFVTGHGMIKGHSDGRLIAGPEIPGLVFPALWENKALKASYWNQCVKHGVRKFEPKYFAQVHLYLGYFKLSHCLFTALNKDTAEIYHEVIPYQVEVAQHYSDRGVTLIRSLRGGFMPRRIGTSPTFYICRMCDRNEHCWAMPA